jgi:hypothetical protein
MIRSVGRTWSVGVAAVALAVGASGCHLRTSEERAAGPILEKNAAARGGLAAWRAVRTMSLSGKLDAGVPRDPVKLARSYTRTPAEVRAAERRAALHGTKAEEGRPVQLPFTMELKRPRHSRLEVTFQGQAAVQAWDGEQGWKLRPFLGRREIEPFTEEERRVAAQQSDLDGPLLDAAAKGDRVELEGTDPVEGRPAYKLKVTSRDGSVRRVWVDAETWLDVKVDGSRRMDGKPHAVWTFLRDYRPEGGLMIPHLLETVVDGVRGSERIVVETVTLNPPVDEARFARPDGA